ncbi:nitrogen regulation protein NR(I) [Pseudolysobacter antarcticus]|uniref:DNA-binding transcriptional regulator NtrC n=1 Tax=Pseudolysobacter antarcticus TaxID=2511995 RepID=A0A411HF71_9GAMM|nr:nitrogen regulation protein NR(I) [Pseudolysobacter antarcticus]QBB69119.1 nitrogen regulation protein NR(I) [Pseudolysobacter antarcticus]
MADIWLADDDKSIRFVLAQALREADHTPREFGDAESLLAALDHALNGAMPDSSMPDLILTDVRMPGASGLKLLERVKQKNPQLPVIVMSAFTDVASTSAAYRNGAFDYLAKPFDLDAAVTAIARALAQIHPLAVVAPKVQPHAELLGQSAAMREVFRAIGRVAATELNVLITGETGTGKELVARALHRHSGRQTRPFVALNTAAIPAELLEAELFGHEIGAFTGAVKRQLGRFEQAEGGTLFLDEIGDMPLALQTRLLRVLAEGEYYRVGGRELIRASVRVIAATHQDLDARAEAGTFRADLLHRLDVVRIHLPALRERRDDIALLATRFLAQAGASMQLASKRFSSSALIVLSAQPWPGNVRQLENLCRRLAVMAPGQEILLGDLPPLAVTTTALATSAPLLSDDATAAWQAPLRVWADAELARGGNDLHAQAVAKLEQILFDAALAANDGHRQRAAQQLGLGRNTLSRKLGGPKKPDSQ